MDDSSIESLNCKFHAECLNALLIRGYSFKTF